MAFERGSSRHYKSLEIPHCVSDSVKTGGMAVDAWPSEPQESH